MTDLDELLNLASEDANILPSDDEMTNLKDQVKNLREVRARIDVIEGALKTIKEQERKLSQEVVPSMMMELGVSSVTTSDGKKVGFKPFYNGKIKPETSDMAFDWLEETGHGGVIKGEVTINYRRPQANMIPEVVAKIKDDYDLDASVKLSVHHSTMRALTREIIENGETLPADLFDVFIGNQTVIK